MSNEKGRSLLGLSDFVLMLAFALTAIFIILSQMEVVAAQPRLLVIIMTIALVLLVVVLVKWTSPRAAPPAVQSTSEEEKDLGELRFVGIAEPASYNEQYVAYKELKQLLINRLKVRRDLTESGWFSVLRDDAALYRLLEDEDLLRLVKWDEIRRPLPSQGRPEGLVFGRGFEKRFDYLLRKVESWS